MKSIAFMVTSPPFSNLTATAIQMIEAALSQNIPVIGVFFYQDGVLNANKNIEIASDEYQALEQWQRLQTRYKLPLHLCFTAAEKRGLVDEGELNNIDKAFIISGLGELVELSSKADRVVQL
jgi:tRNA 2-thiouridine synthesizing protein D